MEREELYEPPLTALCQGCSFGPSRPFARPPVPRYASAPATDSSPSVVSASSCFSDAR